MRMKLGTAAFALCVGVSLLLASCQPGGGVIDSNLVGTWALKGLDPGIGFTLPLPSSDEFNVQYVFSDNAKSVVTTSFSGTTNKKTSTVITGTEGGLKTLDLLVDENCIGELCIQNRIACVLEVLTFLNEKFLYEFEGDNKVKLYALKSQNDTIPENLLVFFASPDNRPESLEAAELIFTLERVQ